MKSIQIIDGVVSNTAIFDGDRIPAKFEELGWIHDDGTAKIGDIVMEDGSYQTPKPHVDPSETINREYGWRNAELERADHKIFALEDADKDNSDKGIKAWRKYRKRLRDWPSHDRFPGQHYRPAPPIEENVS